MFLELLHEGGHYFVENKGNLVSKIINHIEFDEMAEILETRICLINESEAFLLPFLLISRGKVLFFTLNLYHFTFDTQVESCFSTEYKQNLRASIKQ